jgi:hypothetical protein
MGYRKIRKEPYKSPVVIWESFWKQIDTEIKTSKDGEEYEVKVYTLYGTPNKNYKKDKGVSDE